MKKSPSTGKIGSSIAHFLKRYHVVIFALTVVIGVSGAVFLLNGLITMSSEGEAQPPKPTSFDQKTIDRINEFSTVNDRRKEFSLPPGRINPFVE